MLELIVTVILFIDYVLNHRKHLFTHREDQRSFALRTKVVKKGEEEAQLA